MPGVVADTHTIVWYLSKDSRLSSAAHAALTAATTGGDLIHIPSICLVELTYLAEKGRLPSAARESLVEALDDPSGPCTLDRLVAEALQLVQRTEVPDLPDRIVAATALALRVPLISRDRKIRASQVQTIW